MFAMKICIPAGAREFLLGLTSICSRSAVRDSHGALAMADELR
jgi:hypothetical protein